MNDLLTIRQIEDIAGTLRKYRLTPADALTVAKALVHAVDGPVAIRPEDLASLMRPRRPAPRVDPNVIARREALRVSLPGQPGEYLIQHHREDLPALKSAVQYRARVQHFGWSVTVVDATHALVTLSD